MIRQGGTGNTLSYALAAAQSFMVESLSADIDTTAVAVGVFTYADVIFRDNAGLLIARSRSSSTLLQGGVVTLTFAPDLPDTFVIGNNAIGYVNTTGLCATTLPAGGSVTVQVGDPAGLVTGFRMWVEDAAELAGSFDRELLALGPWRYVIGAGA